ncbi:MAG TPA: MotA/TolQ/ExbB proton channel family protein, partial [Terriglobales bacterium]|nr:MotA/TolQ/ExbB proton channel family protein [Terriglobales bacterium]
KKSLMFVAHAANAALTHASVYASWIFQEGGTVGWDPISLWHQMGILAKIVVIILFIMSGWSIGVMIDRWMAFSAARKQSRAFAPAVAGALREGKIDEAIRVAERNKKSHLAKVVTAGLQEFRAHSESGDIPGEQIEASKRALERAEAIVHAELKRGLSGLATIGSTAPFVGLFGTVVGILNAFKGISEQKATGLGAVAGGIAEALVTTAVGLFVAIPAVMMFNYLTSRVEAFDVEMDNSSSELIDYFLKRRGVRR